MEVTFEEIGSIHSTDIKCQILFCFEALSWFSTPNIWGEIFLAIKILNTEKKYKYDGNTRTIVMIIEK